MPTPYWEVKFTYRHHDAIHVSCFLVHAATSFQAATVAVHRSRQRGWRFIKISNVNESPINLVIEDGDR